jgi:protein-disulfide isomerase
MEFDMQRSDNLTWVVILLLVTVTAGLWWQTRRELQSLRAGHAQLASDLAELRGMPVIDVADAPALGSDEAVVTLVEYSDYECPFCIRHFNETMPKLAALVDAGRLRYVFKDLPIDQLHPDAIRAHEAARCAGDQGKFWALHGRLFSPPGSHTTAALEAHARAAGIAAEPFKECLESGRHTAEIQASVTQAFEMGARGTPAFYLGVRDRATNRVEILQVISGAQPFSVFEEAVAAVTARVVN